MRIAIYPGSFNPWHEGHSDVLSKALKTFDQVIIAIGKNPDKDPSRPTDINLIPEEIRDDKRINVITFDTLLVDVVKEWKVHAIVKGLRNGVDFEYEKTQQYWNEDLGCIIPTVYFISNRELVHISSSAIRAIKKFK